VCGLNATQLYLAKYSPTRVVVLPDQRSLDPKSDAEILDTVCKNYAASDDPIKSQRTAKLNNTL
jgi:hypothetical protein